MRAGLKKFFSPVLTDRKGVVAVFFAIALIPMLGAVGLAVDSSLGYLVKSRLSKALDAAALAAGRADLDGDVEAVARKYFEANFTAVVGSTVTLDDFQFQINDTKTELTVSAQATRPTYFMRVFGKDELTVGATSVIERETSGVELALVLDVTGSMGDRGKFAAMQKAALDLVGIIYGEKSEIDDVWVSLVPYVASVNAGPGYTDWLKPTDRVRKSPSDFLSEGWRGCTVARDKPYDGDDTPPSEQLFTSYFFPSGIYLNDWPPVRAEVPYKPPNRSTVGSGPNIGCNQPITPLTRSRARIDAALKSMFNAEYRFGTIGSAGLAWGWRTISPRWRGLWAGDTPATHPLDYNSTSMEKVVVILTDGENLVLNGEYSAYYHKGWRSPATKTYINSTMAKTCESMKGNGITIYAITFGSGATSGIQKLFRKCAEDGPGEGLYFHAPSNSELSKVFKAIGGAIASLKIIR